MRNAFLISVFIFLLTGCKKDKYTTAPQLKYKSVNTNMLGRGQTLVFTLSFTDAEGDLTDDLIVKKEVKVCPAGLDGSFEQPYRLPEFPAGKNQKGDLIVTYDYNSINPICDARNDTAIFKFVLRDKAQHVSDTAVSEPIVITF